MQQDQNNRPREKGLYKRDAEKEPRVGTANEIKSVSEKVWNNYRPYGV
jgi:hypothetical protein